MDKLAQKVSDYAGSAPFILFHVVWFIIWTYLHYASNFDEGWKTLTVIVSLEAIFLALFILRAETIQSARQHKDIKKDLAKSDKVIKKLDGKRTNKPTKRNRKQT